jgi:hypothetical protein
LKLYEDSATERLLEIREQDPLKQGLKQNNRLSAQSFD